MTADVDDRKRCARCQLRKDATLFNRVRDSSDGRDYYCKVCRNQITKAWRKANPDKITKCLEKDAARKRRKYWERKNAGLQFPASV